MFFEIYRLFSAGLNNFASRFWYLLPMAVAIIVLTRLRPHVRLLAMAVSMKPDSSLDRPFYRLHDAATALQCWTR